MAESGNLEAKASEPIDNFVKEAYLVLETPLGYLILQRFGNRPTGITMEEIQQWPEYKTPENDALRTLWALSALRAVRFSGYRWSPTFFGLALSVEYKQKHNLAEKRHGVAEVMGD